MVDRNTPRGIRNGIPYDSDSPCYSTLPNILNEASLHGSDRTDNLPSYKAATAQPSAPNYEQALESEPIASRQLEEENLRDDELPGKAERRIPNAQLRKVSIRLNLIKSAKRLLCFLKEIDLLRDLYTGVKVKAALYRYEFLWLPLLAKSLSGPLVSPPLDVHWVWIVHMLSPVHYEKDCLKIVGKILPHRLLSSEALEKSRKQGREAWERRYPCMPWNLTPESILSSLNEQPISQISYGLKDAIKRQSAFYYQVSMPHYTSKAFLYRSVHRYRQFLALKKANPSEFLVPCYDIDIIWHTHLVHPIIYKSDTESLLGGIFPHDDSVNDRSEGSKLVESDSKTRSLWMSAFGTSFRREGAMFRGDPPINYLHSISAKEEQPAKLSKFHLQITQVKLIGNFPSGPLKLKLKKENRKLAEFTVFHSDAEDREHNVVDLNLKFTLLQRDLKDWIVLKVQSDRKIGKVLKLFGKGSFWCMSHMEELFRLKTQQTITKVFVDDSSSSSVEVKMSVRRELTTDWALIGIMTGDFKPHILEPSLLTSRYGMVTSSRSNNQDIYLAEMATHRLLNESDPTMPLVLEVEVFHSRHFLFSAVHLYVDSPGKGRSLVGLAHTIDHNTIPSPAGFKPNASSYDNWTFPTLDLNAGERAMVIKTRGRDWALLIGSWEGMRKGVKGSFSSRGIAGSPGYLKVRIHVPMGKKPVVIVLPYERQIYSFKMTDLHVDMLRGRLQVSNDCPDFVEQVSLGLAITVLHVLCQPRPVVEDTVDAPTSSEDVMTPLPDFAAPRRIPAERLKFLAALGFFCASAPTNTMLARGAASRFGDRAVDSRAASAGHWPFYVVPLTFHPAIDDDVGDTGGCGGCGGGVFETLPPPSNTLWGSSGGTSDSAHGGGGDSADFGDIGGGDGGASVFNALFSAFGGGGDGGGGGGDVGGGGDGGGDGGGCGGCGGCGG